MTRLVSGETSETAKTGETGQNGETGEMGKTGKMGETGEMCETGKNGVTEGRRDRHRHRVASATNKGQFSC